MILNSIRLRISAASLMAIAAALFAANILISNLFKEHATRQFEVTLQSQLNQLASLIKEDSKSGKLSLTAPANEPRWSTPFSGFYWQINYPDGQLLRSRSLWDSTLTVNPSPNSRSDTFYYIEDFNNQHLLALTKMLSIEGDSKKFLLTVATDTDELKRSILTFQTSIQGYLLILAFVLLAILFLQITLGLSPLTSLKNSLNRLDSGDAERIEGEFPIEFNPLVNEFNAVLDRNQKIISRARTQAGNLAHAMKTPIAVISNALVDKSISCESFKELVDEQICKAKEQIDWNLAKARAATASKNPRLRTLVLPVVDSIVRVMEKVYAGRKLTLNVYSEKHASPVFNGDQQDLQEIVGNLIDNACKWAKSSVLISIKVVGGDIWIAVEDDGKGILPDDYSKVLKRGFRADEMTQGSGLGLAIVDDLIAIYEGDMQLSESSMGGLKVSIRLPAPQSV